MKSFLTLLFNKGRIGFLREIASYYKDLADELKGVVKASIDSATELSQDAVDKIKEALVTYMRAEQDFYKHYKPNED